MSAPSTSLRLPLQFVVARMRQECDQFVASDWISHFNTGAYEHGWSCLPLRSTGGDARQIMPLDGASYGDTPQLARCPYLRQVIDRFECEVGAARLMALEAGAVIREHTDPGTALADGVTRIHDGNVHKLIASLRHIGAPAAVDEADRLAALCTVVTA